MATATFTFNFTITGADQAEANQKALDNGRVFCKAVLGDLDQSLFDADPPNEATVDTWDKPKLEEAVAWYLNEKVLREKVKAYKRAAIQATANAQAEAIEDWTDDSPIT